MLEKTNHTYTETTNPVEPPHPPPNFGLKYQNDKRIERLCPTGLLKLYNSHDRTSSRIVSIDVYISYR